MTPPAPAADDPAPTRGLWLAVAGFGALLNPLLLTGPLFMLQVYDRVLAAGSAATLGVLFALVAFLHAMMALIDTARARLMLRIGARLRAGLEPRVIAARLRAQTRDPPDPRAIRALDDLDAVQRAVSSPALLALIDTPWAFAFLALLFLLHPAMGALAVAGGGVLALIALAGQLRQRRPRRTMAEAGHQAEGLARTLTDTAQPVAALGLAPALSAAWLSQRQTALAGHIAAADRAAFDSATARSFRLFMQSAMLALGAWLVLQGHLSPGLIMAASILMGRALAPVEQLAVHWPSLLHARAGWHRLRGFLDAAPAERPRPTQSGGALRIEGLVAATPGTSAPRLRLSGFTAAPGIAVGVIGPSGSGKTTLAGALLGLVPVLTGTLRLGESVLPLPPGAAQIGYLPQNARLFPGTIGQNIARFDPAADLGRVAEAARLAGIHAEITALPLGYDTVLDAGGGRLSGGQMQRVALARALFGAPSLLILDEPNAQLDSEGAAALNAAIRAAKARGAVVLVLAHRPAAISECDDLLVLDAGAQVSFGPRDQVLRDLVRNHTAIVGPPAARGPA
ncbi:MAG: ATP-binding cassette domain-containing protein [Rhodobacter sp.]|nr:ATP-binding cassette domain-containing protein [Paracoccaceae bacterium]MCC0075630.1 ATP-binding cassette domain-containing protein [Rhodobacter sp.]